MFQFIAFSTKRGRSQPGNLEWRLGKLSCAGLTMSNYCAEARGPSSKNLRYFCSRKEGRLEGKCVSYYLVTFSGRIHNEVSSFEAQWWPSNPWQRTGTQQGTEVSHQTYQTGYQTWSCSYLHIPMIDGVPCQDKASFHPKSLVKAYLKPKKDSLLL